MEKESKPKAEANSGLMKKTKAQLVEIILRKDDVERKLTKELSDMILHYNDEHDSVNKLTHELKCLEERHEDVLDELSNNIYENEVKSKKIKQLNAANWILFIASMLALFGLAYMVYRLYI
jgi:hypothetical protein